MARFEKSTKDKAFKPLVGLFVLLVVALVFILLSDNEQVDKSSLNNILIENTTKTTVQELTIDENGNVQISALDSKTNAPRFEQVNDTSEEQTLEVYFFDVGQADCILVKQNNHAMMIDAGNEGDGKYVTQYIKNDLGINHLEVAVGTHVHEDHIGGLDDVINGINVDRVLMPATDIKYKSKAFLNVKNATEQSGLEIENPEIGDTFLLGGANVRVVYVDNDWPEDLNNSSIVLEITYGDEVYWFMGDARKEIEKKLETKHVNLLKVGHHGSKTSSSDAFIKALKPDIAIITSGPQNKYNLPAETIVKRLLRYECDLYRTDEQGTIHVITDGTTNQVETLPDVILDGSRQ